MVIKFSEIYKNLICEDIPKKILKTENYSSIPQEFQKKFIPAKDGFIINYCEEYPDFI